MVLSFSSRKSVKRKSKGAQPIQNGLGSLHSFANASPAQPGAMFSPMSIADQWDVDEDLWDRPWSKLSGGESQRIALAIAVGIPGAEILLLDGQSCASICLSSVLMQEVTEPTSALDAGTTALVEASLQNLIKDESSTVKAVIWITHSEEQGRKVGTRFLLLEAGGCFDTIDVGVPSSRRSRSQSTNPSLLV
jgi:UDP-glucose/iron transport system ATP-binding protein